MSEFNSAGYAAKVKALSNKMYMPILNRSNSEIYF